MLAQIAASYKPVHPSRLGDITAHRNNFSLDQDSRSGSTTFGDAPDGNAKRSIPGASERRLKQSDRPSAAYKHLLRRSKPFRMLFGEVAVGLALTDLAGRFIDVNRAYSEITGYTKEELYSLTFQSITHPEDLCRNMDLRSQMMAGERNAIITEKRYVQKAGTIVWARSSISAVRDNAKVIGFVALVEDVTERKRAEAALWESETNYRALIERSPHGIVRSTPDGRLLMVNSALVRMLGYDSETELLRANLARDIYADPTERARNIEMYSKIDRIVDSEVQWKRKDGRQITARGNGRIIRNHTGSVEYFEVIVEDITERKALEDQLRQAQKMEALGQFAGGIAHDFNNLLLVILGQCQLISKRVDPTSAIYDRFQEIQKAAERGKWLTAQLLIVGRQKTQELQMIDANAEVVADLRQLLERLIGEDIVLVTHLSPTSGRVRADRSLLQVALMNLCVNARDAMPRGGTLTISTENVEVNEISAHQDPGIPSGLYVMLRVSDTGAGIDAGIQGRLFEPFFTTKEPGKGTGLGLAIVQSVVTQIGGYVAVQSEVGQGSTFKIFLPVIEQADQTMIAKEVEEICPCGSETVLLVEDARGVRNVIRDYLESGGYSVVAVETPERALEFARNHMAPIHLLLTDIVMPGIGGVELARQIRAARPNVKVLYMSGYAPRAADGDALEVSISFLQKPFMPEELLRSVRRVLDHAES